MLMIFLPFSNILSLRRELDGTNAEILTWGCDDYSDRIKQWSESCDTQVVGVLLPKRLPVDTEHFPGRGRPGHID